MWAGASGPGWSMNHAGAENHDNQMIFHHPDYFNMYNRVASATVQPSPASTSSSTMSPASTSFSASSPQISPVPVNTSSEFEVKPEKSSPPHQVQQQHQHQQTGHSDTVAAAAMYPAFDNDLSPNPLAAFEPWEALSPPANLLFSSQ